MGAQVLVAAFTGCLFALVSVVLVGFQIARWMFKRWIKTSLPDIIQNMMSGQYGPAGTKSMDDLNAAIADMKTGTVRCGTKCGTIAILDFDQMGNVEPAMTKLGWKFDPDRFDGYGCPACVAKAEIHRDVSGR